MGDKSTARETMKNAGVPTVPGSDGLLKVYYAGSISCLFQVESHQNIHWNFHELKFIVTEHRRRSQARQ